MSMFQTHRIKASPFDGLRGHFLRLSSRMGLSGSSRKARRLPALIPTCSPRICCAFLSHRGVYLPLRWHRPLFNSALNFSGFWQISSGFPWWARSVRCHWGPSPQHGRAGARTTERRAMMTSSKKLARPTTPAWAATWAPSWCLSRTWRRWSSSASSRPPVRAAGASVWSWAHILSKRYLDASSSIQAHR